MTTKHPVVLVHGVFGYGRQRPLWNSWSPYWPEDALAAMRANHVIVDVGALSSDHDRACEAFYQLFGGRVDYGEQHSQDAGHNRYGATFAEPLHPQWSASNPIHLVGHSFGATTAIELYQLICADFFGVGSSHEWVVSITSLAGPLSGSTITHLFGLHDATMRAYTLGHVIGSSLGLWFKLHTDFPVLKRIFDYRMPQWECVHSFREVLSAKGRINMSSDLAVYNILPKLRLERNARLVHMDKVFLISVTTSSHVEFPIVEIVLGLAIGLLSLVATGMWLTGALGATMARVLALVVIGLALLLRKRSQQLDYATIPSLHACMLLMNQRVRSLHSIFDGFQKHEWELNDGAVNVHSMLRTWTPASLLAAKDNATAFATEDCDCDNSSSDERASTASTAPSSRASSPRAASRSSSSTASASSAVSSAASASENESEDDDDAIMATPKSSSEADKLLVSDALDPSDNDSDSIDLGTVGAQRRLQRGRWYVHRVRKNHMAGTHFDSDAPQLFRDLLRVVANEFEQ
ncbi:hypothetical protein Gpo141_00010544 [Globisporangium polare]